MHLTLLSRRLLLALLVAATWIPAAHRLGSRGEAFWLLFPLWVLVGAFILRAIPAPRAQHKSHLAKWSVRAVVILFPIGYCFAMAYLMGATVTWKEILILAIVCILQEAGFQVLCFDFRGHGESDGHTITYGFGERQDVLGAWDHLMTRHDVDPNRIFGFAVSMGASSMLMALPELPGIKAVVADSAFSSLVRMVRHQYRFVPGPLAVIPIALTRIFGWLDADLRVEQVDAVAAIRGLKVPIFFIHGLDDVSVPPDCTRTLFDGYGGPKKLRLEPGAGHGGTAGLDTEQYRRDLRAFFLGQGDE